MNRHRRYDQLREMSWRRALTAAEEAELRILLTDQPETQVDWEMDSSLTEALRHLPDAPLSSNFTSRVLQSAQISPSASARHEHPGWFRWHLRLRWLPRFALAAVVLVAGIFSYHRAQDLRQTQEWVHPLEAVSGVDSLPNPEVLQDFEAIRAFGRNPAPDAGPDEELLKALQ